MSMEQSGGGEVAAAKRAKASDDAAGDGGEDRLSALPDDVLVLILLRLSTADAARTSFLSRRWRRVWTLLPVLQFHVALDPHILRDVLSRSEVPLRRLLVDDPDISPQSLAAWLPAAARRVSGELNVYNFVSGRRAADSEAEASQRGTFELPCFAKATSISLDLGFLGISVPPAGVFARLTDLSLSGVRFHGPGELEDAVSSRRCPCLQKLSIRNVWGLDSVTINSESLQMLDMKYLRGVQQVTVVAPALSDLSLLQCFLRDMKQPIVNISAPQLKLLTWADAYDPSSVRLGNIEHLQMFNTFFFVYGIDDSTHNHACLMLLPQFKSIDRLILSLGYLPKMDNLTYLMEDMTTLPDVTTLQLRVLAEGHAFGACSFHVLRICSGIKRLVLVLSSRWDCKEQTVCSSDCICDQPTNWKTDELLLYHLQELEIEGYRGSEHETAFVKALLNWVTVLKTMTVTFKCSVTESKAKELLQIFKSLSRPGLRMKFYIYEKFRKVPYAPEG
ncbi:hypothetical protein PR202_ga28570 [Eleusine coracana subsp. coracana]|uniref:F-box domain-containing protein n=1 Tax=Eleusine coracana subsp. coracana TaxID=191504 RepID=A0AAV5DJ36_ELECO|nr:hypothetical protein PR202_ga28570 [Eleusine coracana subsp. coracana]